VETVKHGKFQVIATMRTFLLGCDALNRANVEAKFEPFTIVTPLSFSSFMAVVAANPDRIFLLKAVNERNLRRFSPRQSLRQSVGN
jgi:hypothetical protein